MRSPPISQAEIDARIHPHVDELLALWWAEQGATKPNDLDLIASAIPFARDQPIRVLDLCCGPGDVGRAIRKTYPNAHVDGIDRDPFLTSICRAANHRAHIPGTVIVRDLQDDGWLDALSGDYDVVATVNALHWFHAERAEQLAKDVYGTLRAGGLFLVAEPASAEASFAAGFEAWKTRQAPRYSHESWQRLWSRANALLGYDHVALWGPRDDDRIGDGMTVAGWMRMLERAGFDVVDVLLRDADQVVLGAMKIDARSTRTQRR
jgi:SAM-dependent methyltransferase